MEIKSNIKTTDAINQANLDNLISQELLLTANFRDLDAPKHFVQFYEAEDFLLNSLRQFALKALTHGEALVIVATKPHREKLEKLLRETGIDVAAIQLSGQYTALDAEETLSRFMVEGKPDARLFFKVIGEVIAQASQSKYPVRVFGEMVAILFEQGNPQAAIYLEELWNNLLHKNHSFSLFCAYPINSFDGEMNAALISDVCREHSQVIPTESYTALPDAAERLRTIIQLQQKARSLETEIDERKKAEQVIRSLLRISERLNSTLDLDTLLEELVVESVNLVQAEGGLAGLYKQEGMTCRKYFQKGEWLPFEYCWKPMRGLPGWLIVHKKPYLTNDAAADTQIIRELCEQFGVRQALCTPILNLSGEPLGFFEIHNKKGAAGFTEADREHLAAVSQIAAIAIQNALVYREIQQAENERAELLAREQIARTRAEEANRLKDEFLATVSHELRTPLNAILGWACLLRENSLDKATICRAIETIENNAKAQAQLIEDILDVSRVITGKLRLNIAPIDIAAIINDAIDSVLPAADSKDIQIGVRLDSTARHILGDASRLQQVIWNLLSNAIKFTPSGGRVEIGLERQGDGIQISVSDTGKGIGPEFLPFIFDRFRQLDATASRRYGGLGLGLAVVRHLIELHGGIVWAESQGENQGSTFIIRLPKAIVHNRSKNRRPKVEITGLNQDFSKSNLLISLEGVRVLIVDDNEDNLQMLALLLRENKAAVQTALTATAGLEMLEWFKPNVLVSDLAMPDEDGYSLIAKLRASEKESYRQIPAIALTGYARVEDRMRALSAGFNMFVPKPFEPYELITAIANLAETGAPKI